MTKIKTSVIIPTWNGEQLLRQNLPKVLETIPDDCEVIVVENGSEDGSMDYLKKLVRSKDGLILDISSAKQNEIKKEEISAERISGERSEPVSNFTVIANNRNLGFIGGCNQGVRKARGKFVVLLNNDVIPKSNFLQPALSHFEDKEVFAVSFNEVNVEGGWADIFWSDGFFNYLPGEKTDHPHISGWASGGSAVFRKSMWKQLGGFDELYAPFFWEDLDLSYRGWKMGWKIIWEPKSKVIHKHESTISKVDENYVTRVKERNQLLFIWKNITDGDLKFNHNLGLVQRVITGPNYLKVIWSAKKHYRKFGCPRIKDYRRSDREIFELFYK